MPLKTQRADTSQYFNKSNRYRHAGLIEGILWGILGISVSGGVYTLLRGGGTLLRMDLICFVVLMFTSAVLLFLVRRAFGEECRKSRRYLDITGVIILALDAQQRVTLINKKGCEVLGLSEREIIGKNWFDHFIPAKIRVGIRKVFDDLRTGRVAGDPGNVPHHAGRSELLCFGGRFTGRGDRADWKSGGCRGCADDGHGHARHERP